MPLIDIGRKVPDFTLESDDGSSWTLSEQRGITVLFVYPQDDTPGCTTEACAFRDLASELASMGAQAVGLSPDDGDSHRKFIKKHRLNLRLLVDRKDKTGAPKIAAKIGAWGEKMNYGKTYVGLIRMTYVIARDRTVLMRFDRVKATGHAERVVESLRRSLDSKKK